MSEDRLFDVAVVGGGIVGLATAFQLLRLRPALSVVVIEKEAELGVHQTGHNSGVLHAGLYYAPGSLKARLCREGKVELERFADEHGIPYRHCGKLVVALDEKEDPSTDRAQGARLSPTASRASRRSDQRGSASLSRTSPASGRCGLHGRGSSIFAGSPSPTRMRCEPGAGRWSRAYASWPSGIRQASES